MSESLDDVWPEILKAFAFYGRQNIRSKLGPDRRKLLQKRIDDGFTPTELVAAVHGYTHSHGGLDRVFGNGLTSGHYLRPETVFKAEGFEDRVERGLEGPWRPPKKLSGGAGRDSRDVMAEALRRQQEDDARRVSLRAVEG